MSKIDFPYANDSTRFLSTQTLHKQPFAIVGIPFDGAVTNRPGARFGPQAIRRASLMLCDGIHPYFDISPIEYTGDTLDLQLPNTLGLHAIRKQIEVQVIPLINKHHCIFLGGDHSVTLALLRATYQKHGKLALLHFDAHCDTWKDHFGEPSGHGTWVYEAIQEGLVDPTRIVQIGIRSSGHKEAREYVQQLGGQIFTATYLRGKDSEGLYPVIEKIRQRLVDTPCYLSLDIDCLDPAFAPGTGTPEPGGLTVTQVLTFLETLTDLNLQGMDCTEVAPAYDHADLTSYVASTIVWTYLSGQVAKHYG
jgi:agmatinase